MKNPMTPEEMKQAVDDNAAGYDMQYRMLLPEEVWLDRKPDMVGKPLNFKDNEYRRKPEPFHAYVNEYENNDTKLFRTLEEALKYKGPFYIRTVRLVEDPIHSIIESYKPEDKNPWRKVIPNKTPDFAPTDLVTLAYRDGNTFTIIAGDFNWASGNAIKWRYATEDSE